MTETNNRSDCGLDNRRQAKPPRLRVESCSISTLGSYLAWMIDVSWLDHVLQHYKIMGVKKKFVLNEL